MSMRFDQTRQRQPAHAIKHRHVGRNDGISNGDDASILDQDIDRVCTVGTDIANKQIAGHELLTPIRKTCLKCAGFR
jgi:hypothetical protein